MPRSLSARPKKSQEKVWTASHYVFLLVLMAANKQQLDPRQCGLCACFNLRKAARAVTQMFDSAFQPLGLRANQFSILAHVANRGPINISDLAQRLVMDRTTLSRDLGPLEKRRWVKVEAGEDRRTRAIELTAAGRRLLERALPIWQETQSKVVEGLGLPDFQDLLGNLSSTVSVAKGTTN